MLVRRFFLFETLSGITGEGNYLKRAKPEVVRYAKGIKLKIRLDESGDNEEMIYPPYLEIDYEEKKVEDIEGAAVGDTLTTVTFVSEYSMDTGGFWGGAEVVFWILIGLLVALVLQVVCVQLRQSSLEADQAGPGLALIKGFTHAVDYFSTIFFWYLVAMCGWWFAFFKF